MTEEFYESFKSFINFIETEFMEERLFGHMYVITLDAFKHTFGQKIELIEFVEDFHIFKIQYAFDNFVFSHREGLDFLVLESSYTDGLLYLRPETPLSVKVIGV